MTRPAANDNERARFMDGSPVPESYLRPLESLVADMAELQELAELEGWAP